MYFLFISILFAIPGLSPVDPLTSIIPFAIVILVGIIREGYEDFKKASYDRLYNNSLTTKFSLSSSNLNKSKSKTSQKVINLMSKINKNKKNSDHNKSSFFNKEINSGIKNKKNFTSSYKIDKPNFYANNSNYNKICNLNDFKDNQLQLNENQNKTATNNYNSKKNSCMSLNHNNKYNLKIEEKKIDNSLNNNLRQLIISNNNKADISTISKKTKWKDLHVGDIIRIKKDEVVPADVVIINSSLNTGYCYLETTNIDGESALKIKEALSITQNISPFEYNNIIAHLSIDLPNKDVYSFEGYMKITKPIEEKLFLKIENLLLRSGKLKNVEWIDGLIVYTGKDTKIMKNIQ